MKFVITQERTEITLQDGRPATRLIPRFFTEQRLNRTLDELIDKKPRTLVIRNGAGTTVIANVQAYLGRYDDDKLRKDALYMGASRGDEVLVTESPTKPEHVPFPRPVALPQV